MYPTGKVVRKLETTLHYRGKSPSFEAGQCALDAVTWYSQLDLRLAFFRNLGF